MSLFELLKKIKALTQDKDLNKAYLVNGVWMPELSDVGKPHPIFKDRMGHIDKVGKESWAHKKDVDRDHLIHVRNGVEKSTFSDAGRANLKRLAQIVITDPDRSSLKSGTTPSATGNFSELRLRHISKALRGLDGHSIKENSAGDLEIFSNRHSNNKNTKDNSTMWRWNGKTLKSFSINPIGKIISNGEVNHDIPESTISDTGRDRENRERSTGRGTNKPMGGSLRARDNTDSGRASNVSNVPGNRSGIGNVAKSGDNPALAAALARNKTKTAKWRIKIKGVSGYHLVSDVIAPQSHLDTNNVYLLQNGNKVHSDDVEHVQVLSSLEKYIELTDGSAERLGQKFTGKPTGYHVKTIPLENGVFHHIHKKGNEEKQTWKHVLSHSADPKVKGAAEITVIQDPYKFSKGKTVDYSSVSPEHKGKGLGKVAYKEAIKYHGRLFSDTHMTDRAHAAWRSLPKDGDISVNFAEKGNTDRHEAVYSPNAKLEKGAAKRLFPFNPREYNPDDRKKIEGWVENEENRSGTPKFEGSLKNRSLHKLHGQTDVRKNPETGEREFLMYRGTTMGDHHGKNQATTSFTTDPAIAIGFAKDAATTLINKPHLRPAHIQDGVASVHPDQAASYIRNKTPVLSAWVPESAIHNIPSSIGQIRYSTQTIGKPNRGEEKEVIVHTSGIKDLKEHSHQSTPEFIKNEANPKPIQKSGWSESKEIEHHIDYPRGVK